jgi:hypothetical protein
MVDGFHLPLMPFLTGMPDSYFEQNRRDNLAHNREIIESSIEQLEILAPPSPLMPRPT